MSLGLTLSRSWRRRRVRLRLFRLGLCGLGGLSLLVGLGLLGFCLGEFGENPLGIRLGDLGLLGRLAGRLALLHDRLLALERLDLVALQVVAAALGRILQHLVGAADFGEALIGLGVVAVLVGVNALRLRPPSRLDFLSSRIALNAEH